MPNPFDENRKANNHALGATWTGTGVNFAIYSSSAERVELCIFRGKNNKEERRELKKRGCNIFYDYYSDLAPGDKYGYRVHGAYSPEDGLFFNPNKLLIDPYAKKLSSVLKVHPAHFHHELVWKVDSAPYTPKCIITDATINTTFVKAPNHTGSIIYELNVKGYTQNLTTIEQRFRGKFAALSEQCMIDYFNKLGVTTLEIMPIHAYVTEKEKSNFWGYQSINFFSPHPDYLAYNDINEIKTTIARLHEANIKVILDVVYNHTGEGGINGPLLSYKGIDNLAYYRQNQNHQYIDYTGCGNSLNFDSSIVIRLVMDSLRYWVEYMQVDGFRFDLASQLFRQSAGFNSQSGIYYALMQDPIINQVSLIAEPWDMGEYGYQLGNFPPNWFEWNDFYRDTVRKTWLLHEKNTSDLLNAILGSPNIFFKKQKTPSSSINYITCHDGFTLEDLVSYNEKNNWANGEANKDGSDYNFSYNHGVEGKTNDPDIVSQRIKAKKNMLTTLLLSQGTAMLFSGDEVENSQSGNNNAYCQDNEIGWINWDKDIFDNDLLQTISALVRIRNQFNPFFADSYHYEKMVLHGNEIRALNVLNNKGHIVDINEPFQECLFALMYVKKSDDTQKCCRFDVLYWIINLTDSPAATFFPDAFSKTKLYFKLLLDTAEYKKSDKILPLSNKVYFARTRDCQCQKI